MEPKFRSRASRFVLRDRGPGVGLGLSLRLSSTTAYVVTAGRFDLIRGLLDILGKRHVISEAAPSLQGDF